MNRNRKVEVLPALKEPSASVGLALEQLVESKVQEVLSTSHDWVMEPFFQPKRVSDAIRRMQSLPEKMKWNAYFQRWGCLSCHHKNLVHASTGFCQPCHNRVVQRLQTVIKELGQGR